jgi:hypothetical protein
MVWMQMKEFLQEKIGHRWVRNSPTLLENRYKWLFFKKKQVGEKFTHLFCAI